VLVRLARASDPSHVYPHSRASGASAGTPHPATQRPGYMTQSEFEAITGKESLRKAD
jgi:hypothetical protein